MTAISKPNSHPSRLMISIKKSKYDSESVKQYPAGNGYTAEFSSGGEK
jgi:hypothetical protein